MVREAFGEERLVKSLVMGLIVVCDTMIHGPGRPLRTNFEIGV